MEKKSPYEDLRELMQKESLAQVVLTMEGNTFRIQEFTELQQDKWIPFNEGDIAPINDYYYVTVRHRETGNVETILAETDTGTWFDEVTDGAFSTANPQWQIIAYMPTPALPEPFKE